LSGSKRLNEIEEEKEEEEEVTRYQYYDSLQPTAYALM
jgi:hypothetical protein